MVSVTFSSGLVLSLQAARIAEMARIANSFCIALYFRLVMLTNIAFYLLTEFINCKSLIQPYFLRKKIRNGTPVNLNWLRS